MTAQPLALESRVVLSLQLGLGVNNVAPFLQNLVDNVRLSIYIEMRDLLSDVIYILGKLDIRGSGPCKIPNFPSGDGRVPSGLPVRQQAGFDPLFKWDSLSPLV